jgi:D-glycero-D-manno-heptose 1,7-bisphosphate phosphatase
VKKRRAVFLDRDGTINEDVGYPSRTREIKIYPYSFEAVKKINRAGFLSVIVTNQSGIGRGLLTERDLDRIHGYIRRAFSREEAHFDGIYYCPHYLRSATPRYRLDCSCRKPFPEMGLRAAETLNIDLHGSYMIGDKVEDILFGRNIQAKPILVLTGYGRKSERSLKKQGIRPAHIAPTLIAAVDWIMKKEKK